ncbi:MAG: UDP-N-acetylmuramate dehydrogenase [Pygmaiobacter sp.]
MELFSALCEANIKTERNVPLAPYTTFHIGGNAALLCTPESDNELTAALKLCREYGSRFYLLGRGSNTLFADEGFDGVVLHLAEGLDELTINADGTVVVGAGTNLMQLCKKAAELSLSGLEFAYGIPGSVGGAIYMNAGAYGGEMKELVTKVEYLDQTGHLCTAQGRELCMSYRTSRFAQQGGVILRAFLQLYPGRHDEILAKMEELRAKRAEKQPLDKPSAGSTFKRPKGAYAAELIDRCGLKGHCVGGAAVSEKHSGFVVNLGNASCADVLQLCDEVSKIVKEKTGFTLEKEIKVVK